MHPDSPRGNWPNSGFPSRGYAYLIGIATSSLWEPKAFRPICVPAPSCATANPSSMNGLYSGLWVNFIPARSRVNVSWIHAFLTCAVRPVT